MDTLFTDPFYHITLNFLSYKDLHSLKWTCKHLYNTINLSCLKNITLKHIRNDLHKIFGDNYNQCIQKMKQLMNVVCPVYNKYYVIDVGCVANNSNNLYITSYTNTTVNFDYTIYGIKNSMRTIYTKNSNLIHFVSFDKKSYDVQTFKTRVTKYRNDTRNVYWIENDSDKQICFTNYL